MYMCMYIPRCVYVCVRVCVVCACVHAHICTCTCTLLYSSIRLPPFRPPSLSPFFLPSGVPSFIKQCVEFYGTPACARVACGTPRCWHHAWLALPLFI